MRNKKDRIIEINNKTKSKINLQAVKETVEKFCKDQKIKKDISIAFVGDRVMRRLNKQCRGLDKTTDILSFASEDNVFLGEIIIDYAQIKRQSKKYSKSVKEELIFILIHGLLHLIGQEDETEAGRKKMEKAGVNFIKNYLKR